MKFKKFLLAILAFFAVFALVACGETEDKKDDKKTEEKPEEKPEEKIEIAVEATDDKDIYVIEDTTSVYDEFGPEVTIDQVTEKANGLAFITVEGKEYELGMDFLSMAMVFNCAPAGDFTTEEEVYNEWWRLYIQRWNYLMPEVPLYSNQYYDVYAAKISNFVTSPYWGANMAAVGASSEDGQIILGSSTELSGLFRNASFGKKSPAASDQDVQQLLTGYDTVVSNFSGSYIVNEDVVEKLEKKVNEDGTLTYTIEIKTGLKDSKNREITADYYIASTIVANTPIYGAAGGSASGSTSLVGYKEFLAYNGSNDGVANEKGVVASKYFKGIQKLGDYKWAVNVNADQAGYYYSIALAAFAPSDPAIYLCGAAIETDADGFVKLEDKFYAKETVDEKEVFTNAAKVAANIKNNSADDFAYTGPFMFDSYDTSDKKAKLVKNPYYVAEKYRTYQESGVAGNIETIFYVKVVSQTQNAQLQAGEVNVLEGITGGADTDAALQLVAGGQFKETHYDRAGYGKLAFKCDYGPTNFVKVRQAIVYTINRDKFAKDFTGGYGTVVHGPYYKGSSAFKAVEDDLKISEYAYSTAAAKNLLIEDGWVYSLVDGKIVNYVEGTVRYKKLAKNECTEANIYYQAKDGAYKTVKAGGDYYMPLVINWYGTPADENEVTALLKTSWEKATAVAELGFYITATEGDFQAVLYGQYYQMPDYGYTQGNRPICSCANFATGFNSAVYDYSYSWTINADYYMDYNTQLMDAADFLVNYK